MKALVWNIWLARNDRIFNTNVVSVFAIILKCDCMILSWFSAIAEGSKEKCEDSISTIKRSLEFLGYCSEAISGDLPA